MIYLKPLIKRTTDNKEVIEYIDSIKSDEEGLNYLLSNGYKMKDIISQFESHFGIEYVDLKTFDITDEILQSFNAKFLVNNKIIPYKMDKDEKVYYFAINDILNQKVRQSISKGCKEKGYNAKFLFAFNHEIVDKYREIEERRKNKKENKKIEDADSFNAQAFVDKILNKGIEKKVSDIHIESLEEGLQVRYRIDGTLMYKEFYNFDSSVISNIFVRTKIVSGMDISEKRKAQDGRIENYEYDNQIFDFRVSTVNTIFGEKIVLRLFNKSSKILSFKELGLSDVDIEKIKKMLKHKNGIIFLAGATGSGKTTTLYTMIDCINSDELNIYTIENPVEKTIENVNQIQIDELAGVDYLNTLKALLRQDPDVIVVGEIRDSEEADLSLRVSLTGHLVLTTIHANTAIDSISRLLDMDIDPYILGTSSLGFISQRLVRSLCPHCKRKVEELKENEKAWLKLAMKEDVADVNLNNFYEPVGCDSCINGYSGRVAVVEIVEVGETLKKLISKKANISEIESLAIKEGYKSLIQRGIEKAEEGITSLEEIMKQTI